MGEWPDLGEMEPRVGVEPTTCRLRIRCSTTELPRPLIIKDLLPYQTYFRPTAIKLPANCHHSHPKSALCSPTLAWLSSARPERPSDVLQVAIVTIRCKSASLLSLSTFIESGGSADERNALK